MNKQELVDEIEELGYFSRAECADIADIVTEAIIKGIERDGIVKLNDLGTFKKKLTKERDFIHPVTKEWGTVQPQLTVSFKPSVGLKRRLEEDKINI